jgi:hypothetical protein
MALNYLCVGNLTCYKPSDSSAFTEETRESERDLHRRGTEGEKCVVSFLRSHPFTSPFFNLHVFCLSVFPSFCFLSFILSFDSPLKNSAHVCLTIGSNYCQYVAGMSLLTRAGNTTEKQLF